MKKLILFLTFILINIQLLADVKLRSSNQFVKGESFIFEFEAVGSSIDFPEIKKIDKYLVQDLGTSRSLQIVNGNYDEKLTKRYKIVPTNDFTIPSFTFIIDGKEVKSGAKKIVSKKLEKTVSKDFDLTLVASKDSLFVGEDFVLKLVFKYKRGLQITNLGFEQPHFENFWYKKVTNSNKRYEENGYVIQELEFLLFPQKSGELKIDSLRVDVQMVDTSRGNGTFGFFSAVPKIVKIYSNKLAFNVKELPQNVNLIGEFNIEASIDKSEINQGESISYKLTIDGLGNFDDIEDIKLDIKDAVAYDNKPEIKTKYSSKGYEGTYEKSFSIVPNGSTTIPSISLKYFSKEQNKVISKSTKAYNIKVKNQVEKKVVLEKPKETKVKEEVKIVEKSTSSTEKFSFFILGVFITLLIIGLYKFVKIQKQSTKKVDTDIVKLIKKAKFKDELIKILAPYIKKDENLDKLIYECESDKEFKSLQKEIIALLKELKL